jgi:hypothetical protein
LKKIVIILILLLLVVSCTAREESRTVEQQISDYYPFLENTRLVYEGRGNEFAARRVYFDFVKDNQAQLRVDNGGTTLAQSLKIKDGELRKVNSQEGFYYWHKLTATDDNYEVLLKEPLSEGTTWTLNDGRKRYISDTNVQVTTPSGDYKALEVTTEGEEYQQINYYAKDIGLVLSQFKRNETVIETLLKEIKEDSKLVQRIKFFYPDFSAEESKYISQQVEFRTNDTPEEIFTAELQKEPAEGLTPIISENTKINNIELNQAENIVKVDFSKELVTDMNAGHLLESLIIQSIVNTFGHYYNVDKVYLSLAGQPYQSGHMMIERGEHFEREEDIVQY